MTGPRKPSVGRKLEIQRIAVDAKGYDSTGAYWGAGPDVFILTTADGRDEITVRARSAAEARRKAQAELDRPPGAPRQKEPIGGVSPHTSRYEVDWRDPVSNTTLRLLITHARDYLSQGSDHVEIESLKPKRAPLPITETGYRSHFIDALALINAGGPVTFVTAWLDREAKERAWSKVAAATAQGDLFQWAAAQAEVGRKRMQPKVPRKDLTSRRRRNRDTEPT